MIKVAILTPGFLPVPAVDGGAIENIITYLINENEKSNDITFDVYTRYDKRLKYYKYKSSNIIEIKKNLLYKGIDYFLNKIHIKHNFRFNQIVNIMNSKDKYDYVVVENNMQLYEFFCKKYKYVKDSKIIFHLHNNIGGSDKPSYLCKYIAHTSKEVIVVSNFLKKRWIEVTDSKNVKVLYNTIETERFLNQAKDKDLAKKYNISKNDIVFTYCGRLDEEKGVINLIKAFNNLYKKYDNIKLLIIGKAYFDFNYEKQAKNISGKNIIYLGSIDNNNISKYFSISDVVVIPTISEEAFGITAIEAMSSGNAVIASAKGGLPEIINKACGILVNTDDFINNLNKSMEYLINNKSLIKEMGKNSKKYIQKNIYLFDSKNYYENFLDIIRKD